MTSDSLADAMRGDASPAETFRATGGHVDFPNVPREFTHWMTEQRAWRESCVLADLSHHQMDQRIRGPDALSVLSELCVNDFDGFEVGQAKQPVLCDPDGRMVGDGILQRLGPEEFVLSGSPAPAHWLQYNLATGEHLSRDEYDATATIYDRSAVTPDDPHWYTYQIQGPNAVDLLETVADRPLPEVPFFEFAEFTIDGHPVRALRHGMAGEPGFELQGTWADAGPVKEAIVAAGEEHGLHRLGTRAYQSLAVIVGWVDVYVPAIYDGEATAGYREWLSARSFEATFSIAGSFVSDDIADYYLRPADVGYGRLVDFDHDFVGREAVEGSVADPARTLVTLVWDSDDVVDVYASLFGERTPDMFMGLPRGPLRAHYDQVRADGELVGLSKNPTYTVNERAMLSLATVDRGHAEPGTEVEVVWGESGPSANPTVERHGQRTVGATVAGVPYVEDRRRSGG